MKKLFRVSSLINNVTHENVKYDRVMFTWFIPDRDGSDIHYEELIINYSKLDPPEKKNGERYINELFNREEAELLKNELDLKSNSITTIEEVKLPVPDHLLPFGALKPEKGKGFWHLSAFKSYKLPFKVRGFFNIQDAYESLTADDHPTVITRIPDQIRNKDD